MHTTDRPRLKHHEVLELIRTFFHKSISQQLPSKACITSEEAQALYEISSVKLIREVIENVGRNLKHRIKDAEMFGEEAVAEVTDENAIVEEVFSRLEDATKKAIAAGVLKPREQYDRRQLGREKKRFAETTSYE
jgi:hypothetical protein